MKYVEVCTGLKDRGKIEPIGNISPMPRNHEFYVSLFPFDSSINSYLQTNGTISGHKGKHYCDYILIDIDCEKDVEQSRADAVDVVRRLNAPYGINPDELFIWFSGNKGFHIAIISKIYGNIEPSKSIGQQIKEFVKSIMAGIDDNIDYAIYENHRIIRVENSLNVKSNLYKIQISFEELSTLSVDEIKSIAVKPRNFNRKIAKSDILQRENFRRDLLSPVKQKKESEVNDGFFAPPTEGNRNNKLFKQACVLFKASDLNEKSIYEIVSSINHATDNPITDHEVFALVQSASRNRRELEKEPIQVFTVSELIPEYIDSLKSENDKISLCFDSLNNEFNGKLRGQFGIVIGYGGSKKSLYAQNVAFHNIMHHANKVIYSNMEMSNAILTKRFIDIAMIGAEKNLPSIELDNLFFDKAKLQSVLIENVGKLFSDKLKICSTSSMTSERYDELITMLNEKVDILIIDGFSMMGGKGTELELANMHSKELKELSKKHNIFVLGIVHASKGDDLETRDLTRKARASEKIMDNCDFAITMSQLKEEGVFNEMKGVFNCWNKRGSGRRIEMEFEFEKNTLRFKETNYNLKSGF